MVRWCSLLLVATAWPQQPAAFSYPDQTEGDWIARDFTFHTGDRLAELRLHYLTIGKPAQDAAGRVTNAVLILHGTGGAGRAFLSQNFSEELFQPGQPLDAATHYLILPDDMGHGKSSKPSDGLRQRFPHYNYDDMVRAEALLVRRVAHRSPPFGDGHIDGRDAHLGLGLYVPGPNGRIDAAG